MENQKSQSSKRRCVSYASLRALFLGILCFFVGDFLPVDCFANARNDTRTCHCSEQRVSATPNMANMTNADSNLFWAIIAQENAKGCECEKSPCCALFCAAGCWLANKKKICAAKPRTTCSMRSRIARNALSRQQTSSRAISIPMSSKTQTKRSPKQPNRS